jgi:glycosyltransferase involved in cell wall biosynthesis
MSRAPVNRAVESVSAFFPCYNDEPTIGRMVETAVTSLDRVGADAEIIVVNDGSSDGSERVLKHLTETEPRLQVDTPRAQPRLRRRAALRLRSATKQWVFYTDSDGQYDPTELELLVAKATDGIDVVQGYKLNRADNLARRAIGRVYHRFVAFAFGLPAVEAVAEPAFRVSTSTSAYVPIWRSLHTGQATFCAHVPCAEV